MALSPHDGDGASSASARASAPRLQVHGLGDARRAEVEQFIGDVFARRYGADVQHFAPMLVSLQDRGEIVAAAGYRSAGGATLFLERYLPSPVETLLASQAEAQPERHHIVEVGHLAASRAGEGRRLISLIGPHLASQGFVWVVGTITSELRHLFMRMGVTPLALGMADPQALGPDATSWGSYYDHRPVVLAGHLHQALRRLARPARAPKAGQ
ncbi:thermostable hemolysin [Variovorax sp. PAMC 28711]|uniref:thermostable hemolysin n=1 Tax=Variovorax sp. PAMC 28711 TaxID=1795631 RepID=UPI00078BB795|nr:thermostable hemolysin [Variovorax sp. PAMC 28711]AMM26836.1 hypothetical protein AX767_16560 [Variovorax sp. PAMC 28711]